MILLFNDLCFCVSVSKLLYISILKANMYSHWYSGQCYSLLHPIYYVARRNKMFQNFYFWLLTIAGRNINLPNKQSLQSISETELTVLVANHLLGKLGTSSCYLIDKNCCGKKRDNCFCGETSCKMTGEYGDTSIGKDKLAKYGTSIWWS